MHPLEGSLLYRGCHRSLRWLTAVGRDSLVGRGLSALTALVGRYAAGSCILGTSRIVSVPLESARQSISERLVAQSYMWLRRVLGAGPLGRAVSRVGAWHDGSALREGQWARLAGGVLLGVACGRVIDGVIAAPVVMAAVGLVLVIWGPAVLVVSADSQIVCRLSAAWRGGAPSLRRHHLGDRPTLAVVAGVVLCAASGVVAGLAGRSASVWLVAGVLLVGAFFALLWRPEAILLAAAAFPWLDNWARDALGGLGAAWDEGLLLASVALLLWGALVTGRLRLRTVPILVPSLFALAAAVGSIVVSGVPSDVGVFALRVTLEPLLFYFVGFLLFSTSAWLRRVVTVFLVSTTGLALHGLYQFVTHVPTPTRWVDSSETYITTRAFSVIGNPNGLGSVLLIGTLVGLALLLSPAIRRGPRVALAAAVVVQLGGVAVTFSRGAWLGLACGLLALLILAYRRYLLPVLVVGAAGLLAAPKVLVDRFLLVFSESYLSKAAVDGRIYRWIAALDQMVVHPWFGVGLGTFGGSSASRFDYWNSWIDNFYLQMGAEGGLLLLVAFLWVMLRVGKGLVKGSRVSEDPFVRALTAGVFGALVAVAVANVFASVFETLAVGAALWLLAGLSTAAALCKTGLSRE